MKDNMTPSKTKPKDVIACIFMI